MLLYTFTVSTFPFKNSKIKQVSTKNCLNLIGESDYFYPRQNIVFYGNARKTDITDLMAFCQFLPVAASRL